MQREVVVDIAMMFDDNNSKIMGVSSSIKEARYTGQTQ